MPETGVRCVQVAAVCSTRNFRADLSLFFAPSLVRAVPNFVRLFNCALFDLFFLLSDQ